MKKYALITVSDKAGVEALAMGLWPVCYDNSGPANYHKKFQFGTLAKDLNRSDLTHALGETITGRPWTPTQQRAKITSQIRPHFSRERIWLDLLKVYRGISHPAESAHD